MSMRQHSPAAASTAPSIIPETDPVSPGEVFLNTSGGVTVISSHPDGPDDDLETISVDLDHFGRFIDGAQEVWKQIVDWREQDADSFNAAVEKQRQARKEREAEIARDKADNQVTRDFQDGRVSKYDYALLLVNRGVIQEVAHLARSAEFPEFDAVRIHVADLERATLPELRERFRITDKRLTAILTDLGWRSCKNRNGRWWQPLHHRPTARSQPEPRPRPDQPLPLRRWTGPRG
jgi:hypothetical protein